MEERTSRREEAGIAKQTTTHTWHAHAPVLQGFDHRGDGRRLNIAAHGGRDMHKAGALVQLGIDEATVDARYHEILQASNVTFV